MFDYLLTSALLCALLISVIWKARFCDGGNPAFFDRNNTNAMRGFWCIVIILVHIPSQHHNTIQDMVGSFAYIGVTFFFMVSAYGLTLALNRNPDSMRLFWRKRLPKLLIPIWLINLSFGIIMRLASGERITLGTILQINLWVRWLLFAYAVIWLAQLLCKKSLARDILVIGVTIATSCTTYTLQKMGIVAGGIWQTELWGIVWGILLARYASYFKGVSKGTWLKRCVISAVASLVLGVLYLKLKQVMFVGEYLIKIALGAAITMFMLHLNSGVSISNKVSSFLGRISFEIYLIHTVLIMTLTALFPQLSSGVFILCAVGLSIPGAYIIHITAAFLLKKIAKIKWMYGKS